MRSGADPDPVWRANASAERGKGVAGLSLTGMTVEVAHEVRVMQECWI
jgi:hypothetical protein